MLNILLKCLKYFGISCVLSFLLTPVVKQIGFAIHAYALENTRTVHHGKIVRIGGLGIFFAFMISMALFVKPDRTFDAIVIGGGMVFLGGFIDDLFDLKPIVKFGFQLIAAIYVVLAGNISLEIINLPFVRVDVSAISILVSIFWIVGVTNAINLIDGLDGLACGISFIVLSVIGLIAFFMKRIDVCLPALFLTGAIGGFLPFNFNPASIFVGDSGALFLGFMIACLSLLGFKASTFITLGFPIILLFVPLADTSLAIIRRKLKGQKISEADRNHTHHVLMFKMGLSHRNTVLTLYGVTLGFALCALLIFFDMTSGYILLILICLTCWIFIEMTGMIKPGFHPLISLCQYFTGFPKRLPEERDD